MRVNSTTFTVAEYCQQMKDNNIIVNRQYQRSPKVWPPAARSFLIDSILYGFPIPKLSLYQKTDLKTRKTIKEIVDGQQRSQAILDFYNDDLRISTKGPYSGFTYSRLEPEQQQQYLDYMVSVDIFVDTTESDIRELFRRVNSYNVPLNGQEKRHSTYQGPFKWFIYNESNRYSQLLKDFGVFSESQISRMDDSKFIADICVGFESGLISASESKIDSIYKKYDETFKIENKFEKLLEVGFNSILEFREVLGGELTKKYNLYTLFLAFCHKSTPIEALSSIVQSDGLGIQDKQATTFNLSSLSAALNDGASDSENFKKYINNSAKTTDRQVQRKARFEVLFDLLK